MKYAKITRSKTRDVAFQFRMGAGFPGDVNRTHPAAIEPALQDATNPVNQFGVPVVVNTAANSVRAILASDQSNTVALLPFGFSVRPFPVQAATAGAFGATALGSATPPATGAIDILRAGLIISKLNTGTSTKGGAVYVWCTATSGAHIQGGLESTASAGNTTLLDPRYTFNGPPDSAGIVEVSVNV